MWSFFAPLTCRHLPPRLNVILVKACGMSPIPEQGLLQLQVSRGYERSKLPFDVFMGHRSKRWSVLARQPEVCSVNVTVDSRVIFENWRHYVIL